MSITSIKEQLEKNYKATISKPVGFNFVVDLSKYAKLIQKNSILIKLIDKEHEDLRETRRRIPKARTDSEYDSLVRILQDKLYTNVSEDFDELSMVQEELNNYRLKTSPDDLAEYQIRRVYDLWELDKNKIQSNNYFLNHDHKRNLQKVHNYLLSELSKPELTLEVNQKKVRKNLELAYLNGTLFIKGEPIIINKQSRETGEARLLKYIFQNKKSLTKTFSYAEIAENAFGDHGYDNNKKSWRKYRDICDRINKKIQEIQKINNTKFLDFTDEMGGTVNINSKFLPN